MKKSDCTIYVVKTKGLIMIYVFVFAMPKAGFLMMQFTSALPMPLFSTPGRESRACRDKDPTVRDDRQAGNGYV